MQQEKPLCVIDAIAATLAGISTTRHKTTCGNAAVVDGVNTALTRLG
jgi:hypothetical protein